MPGNYISIQRQPLGRLSHGALPSLSPLLSGHQALDTPSLASFQKYDEGIQSQIEVDDRLWTSNASFVARLFQNSDVSAKGYANL